jgi:hypothetical protein
MRLNEFFTVRKGTLLESGSVPGVGAIHIDEIAPTIAYLEKALGLRLADNVLGSVGKKEFSGDIDIALDLPREKVDDFVAKLSSVPGVSDVSKGSVVVSKVKIQNYDANKQSDRPRTGFVQVDFMLGEPGWLKTYYHSPAQGESAYKGGVRTILISVIAALYDRNDSGDTTDDGVPLKSERYLFSPRDGLVRIVQTPVPKKSGQGYTKQKQNEIVGGPWRDADSIAKQLGLGQGAALNSYESLKAAMENNYPAEMTEKILSNFANTGELQRHGVPDDIAHLRK